MQKKDKFTSDFRTKVGLEALRSIQEIAKRYQIDTLQVTTWLEEVSQKNESDQPDIKGSRIGKRILLPIVLLACIGMIIPIGGYFYANRITSDKSSTPSPAFDTTLNQPQLEDSYLLECVDWANRSFKKLPPKLEKRNHGDHRKYLSDLSRFLTVDFNRNNNFNYKKEIESIRSKWTKEMYSRLVNFDESLGKIEGIEKRNLRKIETQVNSLDENYSKKIQLVLIFQTLLEPEKNYQDRMGSLFKHYQIDQPPLTGNEFNNEFQKEIQALINFCSKLQEDKLHSNSDNNLNQLNKSSNLLMIDKTIEKILLHSK